MLKVWELSDRVVTVLTTVYSELPQGVLHPHGRLHRVHTCWAIRTVHPHKWILIVNIGHWGLCFILTLSTEVGFFDVESGVKDSLTSYTVKPVVWLILGITARCFTQAVCIMQLVGIVVLVTTDCV